MKGMIDWNKLTMEQYTEHLEEKFKFDSSGTAKAVFELIAQNKALNLHVVTQRSELFFAVLKWAKQADLEYPDDMLIDDFEKYEANNCG